MRKSWSSYNQGQALVECFQSLSRLAMQSKMACVILTLRRATLRELGKP